MMDRDEGVGASVTRTLELAQSNVAIGIAAIGIMTAVGFATDFSDRSTTLDGIVSIIFQYAVSRTSLEKLGQMDGGIRRRRGWAMVGLCILSELAILAGLVLLVLPGVILAVRWFLSVPILLAEDLGVIEAMRRSWHETADRFGLILAMLITAFTPSAVMVVITLVAARDGQPGLAVSLVSNIVFSVGSVFSWYAAVAIYAERHTAPILAEVFA